VLTNLTAALALTAVLGAPPAGTELPGTDAKIVADLAGRPVQLSYYAGVVPDKQWAWDPAKKAFVETDGPLTVSPGERWEATLLRRPTPGPPSVRFADRRTGRESEVKLPVPEDPERAGSDLNTLWLTWSPDGRHLLVNVFEPGDEPRSEGIVLIDVPSLKARFVRIENALITVGGFQWTRDSKGVVVRWGRNGASAIRQYDLTGAVKRTWQVRGRPVGHGLGTFSPSGRRFVTACTSLEKAACVWDTRTGKAVTRIDIAFSPVWGPVLGWYDEQHLLAPVRDGFGVVDLKGKVVQTLVKVGKKQQIYPWFDARAKS
jgi:WD40 repeat protein